MERIVEPEILDGLPAGDPEAIRSRRDLRFINFLMGNERWILRQVGRYPEAAGMGIVELGAGRGALLSRLARKGPACGVDLAPRPEGLEEGVGWVEGDVFDSMACMEGGILVANLFLHHFGGEALGEIGQLASRFKVLIFVEPLRTELALWRGERLLPLMGRVTRHDMPVSIRAGFTGGELPAMLGLGDEWRVSEQSIWRGGHRVLAWRA